jgi:hypothetical protein
VQIVAVIYDAVDVVVAVVMGRFLQHLQRLGDVKVRGEIPKADEARLIPTDSLSDVRVEWVTFWKNIW